MQKVIREYCEKLYANKLDNLEEMDKFLGTYKLPKLWNRKKENLKTDNQQRNWIIINSPPQKKPSPGPDGFRGKFNQAFQGRVSTYFSQTVPKNRKGRKTSEFILWGQYYPDTKTR